MPNPYGQSIARLRTQFAINKFKQDLLGEGHLPGRSQVNAILDFLVNEADLLTFTERTWESWFINPEVVAPKKSKIEGLDQIAAMRLLKINSRTQIQEKLPATYFTDLVFGGLFRNLTAQSKSANLDLKMLNRAHEYQPLSVLHLHVDAIEVSYFANQYESPDDLEVVAIAANRILDLLSEKWHPRDGKIYKDLTSDLQLKLQNSSQEQCDEIIKSYQQFIKIDLFKSHLEECSHPDWDLTAIEEDIAPKHIYKLLFAIAADYNFLVSDRFNEWYLDLVTAGLAIRALSISKDVSFYGPLVTVELVFWAAIHTVFLGSEELDPHDLNLCSAIELCGLNMSHAIYSKFDEARKKYHFTLSQLNSSFSEIDLLVT